MDEQQMREVAEAAFKRQFANVEIVRINVWQRPGFEDDPPVVDVNIIYDGKYERLNGRGFSRALPELVDKAWREGKDDLGWPCVHFIPKSEIGQRNPASVQRSGVGRGPRRRGLRDGFTTGFGASWFCGSRA